MRGLKTRRACIGFPAFFPVTTLGATGKYPLDRLLLPFLPRFAPLVMASLHYGQP